MQAGRQAGRNACSEVLGGQRSASQQPPSQHMAGPITTARRTPEDYAPPAARFDHLAVLKPVPHSLNDARLVVPAAGQRQRRPRPLLV